METEPHLSGEQQRRIIDLADEFGLGWQDVLRQALDFSRVRSMRPVEPSDIVGFLADDPELADFIAENAANMRRHDSLKTPDA